MNDNLWRHQKEAIQFALERWHGGRHGVMLAMAMGTGKTRTAIELASEMDLWPILILCPVRVIDVWRDQFNQVAPGRYQFLGLGKKAGQIREKKERAERLMEWAAHTQQTAGRRVALAINYESARQEPFAHWSLNRAWPLIILDEAHRAKAATSAISRYAGQLGLRARYRLALTGTPMPHSPLDIWGQYRFLDRTVYDLTFTSFKQRYAVFDGYFPQPVAWRGLDDLRARFESIAFQVSSAVLDLPGEQDQTFTCELGNEARRLYNQMEKDFVAWLASTGTAVIADNAAVRLLRLQQIACGSTRDEAHNDIIVSTAKENLFQDLLEDLDPAEPVVVFARFRADLAAVHRIADRLGLKSAELSGRRDTSALWQRGRKGDPTILAVQMQAGSEGISLVRARYAVYYSTGFSLGLYQQSRARLARPGQTRPVMFYHLIVEDTVDEYIAEALSRRQDLVEGVLGRIKEKYHVHLSRSADPADRFAGTGSGDTAPSGSL